LAADRRLHRFLLCGIYSMPRHIEVVVGPSKLFEVVMAIHLAKRVQGLVYGRYAVLSQVWNHPLNRGSRLKALRDYFLWNAVRYSMDARHVLKLPGELEIILGKKENYGSAVYAHGLSDHGELLFLAHLMRPGDLFADVGANVGMYSVWVAGTTGANAISMEPVPGTFKALKQNIRLNDLSHLIEAHQVATGARAGVVQMTCDVGGLDHIVEGRSGGNTVEVPVARIDDLLKGRAPYAVKIDVEGYELRALQGAVQTLQNPDVKAVVIELQDWTLRKFGTSEKECREFLTGLGFQPHSYDPSIRKLTKIAAGATKRLNEIFVRPDSEIEERLRSAKAVPMQAPI
jgi:FkbM family methyltransferase